jgi:drug/metabolite transporter (DMT)-like permease
MLRSYAWLVFCVTVWGSNFVFGAILVEQFPPMLLAIARLSVTSTFYVIFAWATGRIIKPTLRDWKLLIPISLLTLLNQSSFYIGLQHADPTVSSLITALSPIAVSLLAAVFLGERISLRMAIGSVVAVTGVFFVVGSGGQGLKISEGELWMVVAMMTFAVSMILTRKLTEFRDPFFATSYGTVLGASMLLPVALVKDSVSEMSTELWAWALLIACALVMQVVCGLVWNREMQKVGAGKAAVFLNLQPFVAMSLGYLILNKPVTGTQMIGSILIIGGVLLATAQAVRAMRAISNEASTEAAPTMEPTAVQTAQVSGGRNSAS